MLGKRSKRQKEAQAKFLKEQLNKLGDENQDVQNDADPYQKFLKQLNNDPKINHKQNISEVLKQAQKPKKSQTQDESVQNFLKACQGRTNLEFNSNGNHHNYYVEKAQEVQNIEILKKLTSQQSQPKSTIQYQTKSFPLAELKHLSSQDLNEAQNQIPMNFEFSEHLLQNTTFHKETLDRLGLLKDSSFYIDCPFLTQAQLNASSEKQQTVQQQVTKIMGLEMLGLLSTGKDVRAEFENSEELRRLRDSYILHVVDYVVQDRFRVHLNDKKIFEENNKDRITLDNVFELAKSQNKDQDQQSESEDEEEDKEEILPIEDKSLPLLKSDFIKSVDQSKLQDLCKSENSKDQGFTRPKVLILTPFKQMAYQIVETIVMLLNGGKWKKVSKKKKFREEFGSEEEAFNDYFKIGLAVNYSKKNDKLSLKLYEQFYESDIIIASPLGLRIITGQEDDENAKKESRVDFDFLSSIEFLVMDQAEAFVFQNVEHLEEVLKVINKTPKKLTQLNDISRIMDIYTSDQKIFSKLRQNIFISKFRNLDIEFCLDSFCSQNLKGIYKLQKIHPNRAKQMSDQYKTPMTLRRLPNVKSFEHVDDSRFSFFTRKIWDKLYEGNQGYTVLFVPSYFDFVRLRTFFKNRNAQVAMISEYSEKKDCQRNRHYYETAERPILMITERAIVFGKIKLRYARNIVIYGLPESSDTFTDALCEILNTDNYKIIMKLRINKSKMQKDNEKSEEELVEEARQFLKEKNSERSIVGMFSNYDKLQLERIVGTINFQKMISNEAKDSFSF